MENQIAPALSAEEWREPCAIRPGHDGEITVSKTDDGLCVGYAADRLGQDHIYPTAAAAPAFIALANAALPDDDPRKIQGGQIAALRRAINLLSSETLAFATADQLSELADALESFLPPDQTEPK